MDPSFAIEGLAETLPVTLFAALDEQERVAFRDEQGRSLGLYPVGPLLAGLFSTWDGSGEMTLIRLTGAEHTTVTVGPERAAGLRSFLEAQLAARWEISPQGPRLRSSPLAEDVLKAPCR